MCIFQKQTGENEAKFGGLISNVNQGNRLGKEIIFTNDAEITEYSHGEKNKLSPLPHTIHQN